MDFILDIRIWREGTNAYWQGKTITSCPYQYGTNEFYSWTDGFESAIIPPDDETE